MRYTDSHEWMTLEGDIGTVGITDRVQKELGDIVYIELPKIGQVVEGGKEVWVLESTKAAIDVYAPVSGKIVAVNDAVEKNPASLKGTWLFKIELSKPSEWDKLKDMTL